MKNIKTADIIEAYDDPPRRAAFDPAASVFVSANAGAGKTSLLTDRVLSLLLHGAPPSRILCLTFTNAAAAEMAGRVLQRLGEWVMMDRAALHASLSQLTASPPDERMLERARSLFARVLEAPDGVRIQTIHGFCQSLLRRFPVEAGVSPHFTVMDGRSEQELLREARLRLFNHARSRDHDGGDPALQDAINALARDISETSFQDLLSEIVKNKRKFRQMFETQAGLAGTLHKVWQSLQLPRGTTHATLIETHFNYDSETKSELTRIADILAKGALSDSKTGAALADWLKAERIPLPLREGLGWSLDRIQPMEKPPTLALPRKGGGNSYETYLAAFLTRDGAPRKKLFTKAALTDEALIAALLAEQARAMRFHEAKQALDTALHTSQVLIIAQALLAIYSAIKRAHGWMDYDDLILTACALLQKPGIAPWVLFKLDGGIDHILVDEAQDTSPEQWLIIDQLTQEFFAGLGKSEQNRSLFIVGDEKQSIYSFQGADPRALSRMQRYFTGRIADAGLPVHRLALTHSFRSTREVLASVDAIFAQPAAREGLTFGSDALTHIPTRLEHAGLVELWPLIRPAEEVGVSHITLLARHIADTIHGWLRHGRLESRGRNVQPGDIMILVRSRTALVDRLVRALKRRGVPVAGHDRMALGDNLAVQDLIALGQCLLLPDDDLTLAALLKSPIFGISEEALFNLAWERGEQTLWQRLSASGGDAYALLAGLRAKVDFISPYELYSHLLDTLGARRRITGRMGEEYNDPIDEFLNQALIYERSHPPSLQGFLHWLSASDSEIKRDMEQSQGSVRIMTVHGAKGLQAPIVILPDTVELPRQKDSLLWHAENAAAPPLRPLSARRDSVVTAHLRGLQRQAGLAEYRRLLYVALTRAEDRLFICGATGKETCSDECWYSLAKSGLAALAAPFKHSLGEGLRIGAPPCHPERSEGSRHELSKQRSSADAQDDNDAHADKDFGFLARPVPGEPVPPQPLSPSRLADETASASPLHSFVQFQRGLVIHKLLQYLPDAPLSKREAMAARITARYRAAMNARALQEAIAETLAIIADPECSFLFAENSLAEVPLTGCIELGGETITVSGQIDRLAIGEREVWILDYKSNRLPPARDADTPAPYLRQMRLYRSLLRKIYPQKRILCALLWTAAPKLTVLSEALLDEAHATSYI